MTEDKDYGRYFTVEGLIKKIDFIRPSRLRSLLCRTEFNNNRICDGRVCYYRYDNNLVNNLLSFKKYVIKK